MGIVVNSFEAIAETSEQQKQQDSHQEETNNKTVVLEPQDIASTLHRLSEQTLRLWAH